jgi:hypothetical protein
METAESIARALNELFAYALKFGTLDLVQCVFELCG